MISGGDAVDLVADISAQDASIPAIRMLLLALAAAAALFWWKGFRRGAVALLASAAFAGVTFWMIQIRNPFGLGVDAAISRDWAQAGVNAADPTGGGFVTGTAADRSLFATLTAVGIPSEAVALVPLMAVGGVLLLAVLVPFLILGTRRARDFAVALALAGGLWPGIHAFAAGLRRPGLIVAGFGVALVVLLLLRMGRVRRSLVPLRRRIPFILIVAASLAIAIGGDAGPLTSAVLLVFASALLTSPLRVVLRGLVRPPARRAAIEAIAIVAAFAGSGLLWWNPPQSVPGFHAAREATAALRRPLEWIRANVDPREILIASPSYSIPIAALGQRRVLWPPPGGDSGALPEPFRRARLYESVLRGRPNDRLADRFNATYLLLGPGEPTPRVDREQALAAEEPVRELILVYEDAEDFRVFRLAKK